MPFEDRDGSVHDAAFSSYPESLVVRGLPWPHHIPSPARANADGGGAGMNLLVSPNGHLWDVANGALHKYLGYWGDTASLVTMATGALGFVAVAVADGRVRIRLRPDMFSASSFKMVVGILVHRDPCRIVIDIDDERMVP